MPNNFVGGKVVSPIFKPVLLAGICSLPVPVKASLVVQDITYTAKVPGVGGNDITITYVAGGTAGSEVVTVSGNDISVSLETGVSTATQVSAKITASAEASALVSHAITGTAGDAQVAAVSAPLTSGAGGVATSLPDWVSSITATSTDGVYDVVLAQEWVKTLFFQGAVHADSSSTAITAAKLEVLNADTLSASVLAGTAFKLALQDYAGAEVVLSAAAQLHLFMVVSESSRS